MNKRTKVLFVIISLAIGGLMVSMSANARQEKQEIQSGPHIGNCVSVSSISAHENHGCGFGTTPILCTNVSQNL